MAGAQLLILHCDVDSAAEVSGKVRDCGHDLVAVVADHYDEVLRRRFGDGVQGVRQHAAARQRVQHLVGVGAHARAGACRQDHDRRIRGPLGHMGSPFRRECVSAGDTPSSLAILCTLAAAASAPSPGLEPELSEPKSEVLPITPRRIDQPVMLVEGPTLKAVAVPPKPDSPDSNMRSPRARMTGAERRHQLIDIARSLFAERGYEGTSIEEIAQRANVSKPVVYEHFGGKEGLYAVVVDREMSALLDRITSSLTKMTNNRSRLRIERVALALLTYVDERTDGFRILIRDSPAAITSGSTYSTLLNEAVNQVSSILAGDFSRRGLDAEMAPLYAQALVGSVSMTAQWWLDVREPKKEVVAAHLVNLCWNGLMHLENDPPLLDD